MVKVAVYLRVSSEDQSVENQLPSLEKYCQERGYELVTIYQEAESAWHNGHQKELARLLTDIRHGRRKYDMVLVWALDRLSRV